MLNEPCSYMLEEKRNALADQLLDGNKIVWRHLGAERCCSGEWRKDTEDALCKLQVDEEEMTLSAELCG